MPWTSAKIADETLIAEIDPAAFDRLEQLPRDQWPAR
jgi:hypothetical protein